MKILKYSMTILLLISSTAFAEGRLDKVLTEQIQSGDKSAASQSKISTLASSEKEMFEEYKSVQARIENTKIYNEQMRKMLLSQEQEMISMKKQIEDLKTTNKEILPLMNRMTETIEKFVDLDVPFLQKERQQRVNDLKTLMTKSNVSTSEKFRRILEAYQIENEYGRTIETYRGEMLTDANKTTVDFLRVGRVGFYYQTLDRENTFAWSSSKKKFVQLNDGASGSILKGIKMAQKQLTPNLISLPIEKKETSL